MAASNLFVPDLCVVQAALRDNHVCKVKWPQLGLELGLFQTTLDEIKAQHNNDPSNCQTEMLSRWLNRADGVDSKGGPTLNTLALALKELSYTAACESILSKIKEEKNSLSKHEEENPSSPNLDILYEKIEQIPKLAGVARKLKEKFAFLIILVRRSAKCLDLSELKCLVRVVLTDNRNTFKSNSMQHFRNKLDKIESVEGLFDFLIDYHFIGYLNYTLLKMISNLTSNSELKEKFDEYEQKYEQLLTSSSFNCLMEVFQSHPDLSPTTAVGLPEMILRLDSPWPEERVHSWQEYFANRFPWADSVTPKEYSTNCVFITYVILPSVLSKVMRDLTNPVIVKELNDKGVTIVKLPQDKDFLKFYELKEPLLSMEELEGTVLNLLNSGEDPNSFNEDGETPLHIEAGMGSAKTVEILLQIGARIDIKTEYSGETAFHIAVLYEHEDIVLVFLNHGIDPNLLNESCMTPLHCAADIGNGSIAQILINGGAKTDLFDDSGKAPLHVAAEGCKTEVIKVLLQKGVNVDMSTYYDEDTSLHIAARRGYNDLVLTLLEHGANPNILNNKDSETPLHIAVQKKCQTEMVELLLKKGANLMAGYEGNTPLHIAASEGYNDIVLKLLQHEVNQDILNEDGMSPLYVAADNGRDSVVQTLLDYGARTDLVDNSNRTLLHFAAGGGCIDLVQSLITQGTIDINALDESNRTPLFIAAERRRTKVIDILLTNGAKLAGLKINSLRKMESKDRN